MQKQFHIFNNDNLKVLRKLKANSVDAIVQTHLMAYHLWARNGTMMCLVLRCGQSV